MSAALSASSCGLKVATGAYQRHIDDPIEGVPLPVLLGDSSTTLDCLPFRTALKAERRSWEACFRLLLRRQRVNSQYTIILAKNTIGRFILQVRLASALHRPRQDLHRRQST